MPFECKVARLPNIFNTHVEIASLSIVITNPVYAVGFTEELECRTSLGSLTFNYDLPGRALLITGNATPEVYRRILDNIYYVTSSPFPNSGEDRILEIKVADVLRESNVTRCILDITTFIRETPSGLAQHPDYPGVIYQPSIENWDQTCDVLEFLHLPEGHQYAFESQLGIPCEENLVFDRFTYSSLGVVWAEGYSLKIYQFLKNFNMSPLNSFLPRNVKDVNGNNILNELNNPIPIPGFQYLEGNNYKGVQQYAYTILPVGDYCISFFAKAAGKYELRIRKFSITVPDTNIDLNRYLLNKTDSDYVLSNYPYENLVHNPNQRITNTDYICDFATCSMILNKKDNNGQWREFTDYTIAPGIKYTEIDNFLQQVKQAAIDYFTSNTSLTFTNVPSFSRLPLQHYYKTINYPYTLRLDDPEYILTDLRRWDYIFAKQEGNIITEKFPAYMCDSCYITFANNNLWNAGVNTWLVNEGYKPNFNSLLERLHRNIESAMSGITGLSLPPMDIDGYNFNLLDTQSSNYLIDWNYPNLYNTLTSDLLSRSPYWIGNTIITDLEEEDGVGLVSIPPKGYQDFFPSFGNSTTNPFYTTVEPNALNTQSTLSNTASYNNHTFNMFQAMQGFSNDFREFNLVITNANQQEPYDAMRVLNTTLPNFLKRGHSFLKYITKTHYPTQVYEEYLVGLIGTPSVNTKYNYYVRVFMEYESVISYGIAGYLPTATYTETEITNYTLTITDSTVDPPTEISGEITPSSIVTEPFANRTAKYETTVWTQAEWNNIFGFDNITDSQALTLLNPD